jgi:hypothetical protein
MEKIHAALIFEILGKPVENVSEAIKNLVKKIGEEKGVNIVRKDIREPIKAQGSKTLFTTFAELEVEFESLDHYFGIVFGYMPSNTEIIKPEKLEFTNSTLNEMGNSIISRLHHYDAIAKQTLTEREILLKKLQEFAPDEYKKLITPPKEKKS